MPNVVGDRILEVSDDIVATLPGEFCTGLDKGMFGFRKIVCWQDVLVSFLKSLLPFWFINSLFSQRLL